MVAVAGLIGSLFGIPFGVFLATSGAANFSRAHASTGCWDSSSMRRDRRRSSFWSLPLFLSRGNRRDVDRDNRCYRAIDDRDHPFIARLVETAIREVDPGLTEAARAMGASPMQIVFKVLLAEARPGIARH